MMQLFANSTIDALQQTAIFSQNRHELLAGNLANLDTPGYQSRDLDVGAFQEALADAIATPPAAPASSAAADHGLTQVPANWTLEGPAVGAAERVQSTTRDDRMSGPRAAGEQVVFHDQSDVSLEHQVTQVAKNQHLHSMAITTMRSQFALLRAAITEQA